MKYMHQIAHGIDTTPLALALARQPELWNTRYERRSIANTAHLDTSDIWIRFNDWNNRGDNGTDIIGDAAWMEKYSKFIAEHDSVWYPEYYKLPQLRPIIFSIMALCQGVRLGGVLITKIPAGKAVLPHTDGGWHAHYYNTKVCVPIITNNNVINRVEDECVVMETGSAWYFNNTVEHEVVNQGESERISLIICMRCEG